MSLCLINKHNAMVASVLDGGEWSASRPGRFTTGERAAGTIWTGRWRGEFFLASAGNRTTAGQPVAILNELSRLLKQNTIACRAVTVQRPRDRQRLGKHVPMATDTRATTEVLLETVFLTRSVQRGYKELEGSSRSERT
jgi:hypothetical protein